MNALELKYYVPFRALGEDRGLAVRESLLNIEGEAIDTSVNTNKWQVPREDLDYFITSLQGAQLRIDHAESAMAVIGKVPEAKRVGDTAKFRAEIGDLSIIQKVLRGYLTHVSVQVDSDDVECSACGKQTRTNGLLTHLCPGAWEKVHKPKVRELSIVASPAYKNTDFKPVGFAAAMSESQAVDFPCGQCTEHLLTTGKHRLVSTWKKPGASSSETSSAFTPDVNPGHAASQNSRKDSQNQKEQQNRYDEAVSTMQEILKTMQSLKNLKKSERDAERAKLLAKIAALRARIADIMRIEAKMKSDYRKRHPPSAKGDFLEAAARASRPSTMGKELDAIGALSLAFETAENNLFANAESFRDLQNLSDEITAEHARMLGLTRPRGWKAEVFKDSKGSQRPAPEAGNPFHPPGDF
jgi:hypothetical protein